MANVVSETIIIPKAKGQRSKVKFCTVRRVWSDSCTLVNVISIISVSKIYVQIFLLTVHISISKERLPRYILVCVLKFLTEFQIHVPLLMWYMLSLKLQSIPARPDISPMVTQGPWWPYTRPLVSEIKKRKEKDEKVKFPKMQRIILVHSWNILNALRAIWYSRNRQYP